MNNNRTGLILLSMIIVTAACTQSSRNGQNADVQTPENSAVNSQAEERIYFDIDLEALSAARAGDEISATLNTGETYTLSIQRAQETMPGLLSISANIGEMDNGQAALVYRDSTLRGSINMSAQGMNYQIGFDEESGRYYLTPYTGDDELEGSEPLTYPDDNNH